jgi:hypothetical protein
MAAQRPGTNAPPQQQIQAARQRILRIGILLGGKIVEERLIRERVPVSIGQSMKNTFSIPVEGLPLEFTLFAIDQGRYSLRFVQKMDGRLSDGGQVNTLDALKGRGAQHKGEYYEVPLGDSSRGKLSLGDLTILFQFVTEPPRQPRPMLPASVRGTIADRIDPRLAVILGASILFHFGIMIFALWMDVDTGDSIADRAYNLTFKQDTINVEVEQPKPVEVDNGAGSAQAPKQPDKTPSKQPDKKPAGGNPDAGRNTADDVRRKEEEAAAFADLMTSDNGKDGKTKGDIDSRRSSADLGAQVADAKESGKSVSAGGTSGRGSRGNGDARVGNGKGPGTQGPGGQEQAGGPKVESGPSGRISVSDKQSFDESTLTPDIVLAKIMAAYMAGLKRCYKEYLKKDASARGKVSLKFGVNATGRLVNGNASGVADEVSSCIQGQMSLWRFPIPKDKDGEATEANFAITLQLVPD